MNCFTSSGRKFRLLIAFMGVLLLLPPIAAADPLLLDEKRGVLTLAPLLEKTTKAVVSISVETRAPGSDNPLFRDPYFRRFFGLPDVIPERRTMSAGSGVIIDTDEGHVLTNHHVVNNADRVTVTVKDGRQFEATLVGSDEATDIALLAIGNQTGLAELPLGDSDDLQVGDLVLAIGNPFGLGQTVTSGIVSALGRGGLSTEKYEDFIQTDAPINPGNSGGALINTKGELMGINTAIIAPAGGNVGIGFAVPSNMARAVMDQLLKHGEVRRGRVGIVVQTATPDIAQAVGAPVQRGAIIASVEIDSPAEEAGLQAGDFIIAVDGKPVSDSDDVRNRVGLREIGSVVEIAFFRDGNTKTVQVKVGKTEHAVLHGDEATPQLAGATLSAIPEDNPDYANVEGVFIAEVLPGSAAWRLGLRPGDIILSVNRKTVKTPSDINRIAEESGDVLALNILRGNQRLFIIARS